MASGQVGASDLPAPVDVRTTTMLEEDLTVVDEADRMDVDQQPAACLALPLAAHGPTRCLPAAAHGDLTQQPQQQPEPHKPLLPPLMRPIGPAQDHERECSLPEPRQISCGEITDLGPGMCHASCPGGGGTAAGSRTVHLGLSARGGAAASIPGAGTGSGDTPPQRPESACAPPPRLPPSGTPASALPSAHLSTSPLSAGWRSTAAAVAAGPAAGTAPQEVAVARTVAACSPSSSAPSDGQTYGSLTDEPMQDADDDGRRSGAAAGEASGSGATAGGHTTRVADADSGRDEGPLATGAGASGAEGLATWASLGTFSWLSAAALEAAAAVPASATAWMAGVQPVCPYTDYDQYTAPHAPLVSYYTYAVAEDGDEEDEEEALQTCWDVEDGSEGQDGEEPAEGRGDGNLGMRCGDAACTAGGAAAAAVAAVPGQGRRAGTGPVRGAGGSGDLQLTSVGPSSQRDVQTLRRAVRGPILDASAPPEATGTYDSEMYGSEDLSDIDIDVEGFDAGGEDDGEGEALTTAGADQEGDGVRAQSRTANGSGGAAAWDSGQRPPPPLSHVRAKPPVGPRDGHHRHTRSEGYSQKAEAAAVGMAPWSSRAAGVSGAAPAAATGRSGAGPSSAGAGPSSAGPGGASAGGGAGAEGCWSLRYSLSPEFVSADPWSEDEDEETDTLAEQFYTSTAQPKDIQGIPWERLQFNRSTYRETRLRQYRNYTNVLPDNNGGAYRAELAPLCAAPRRCGTAGAPGGAGGAAARGPPFFSFVRNSRAVQSNIVHFQLRNLVWATSPNDVFVVHDNCVNHWSPAARTITEVLNLSGTGGGGLGETLGNGGGGIRRRGDEDSRIQALGRVQVSTLCVSGDLVAAGGFMGELVVKRLHGGAMPGVAGAGSAAGGLRGPLAPAAAGPAAVGGGGPAGTRGGAGARGPAAVAQRPAAQARSGRTGGGGSLLYCGRITTSDNGITNGLEIFNDRSHGTVIMSANNDQKLRLFAAAAGEGTLRPLAQWPFDWAVNYATVRPDSHLAAVVGDDSATLLTDVHNGTTVTRLQGHQDFSFAAAWHPGGVLLATGNQDTTTLLWDVRKTDEPLTRLAGRMGAIRSLRFTPDGRFLAMSEPADFVHVYDVASGFQDCQEHDFFGEIAGIAFTPDSSSLFVGISDLTYASLMHLERQRCDWGH